MNKCVKLYPAAFSVVLLLFTLACFTYEVNRSNATALDEEAEQMSLIGCGEYALLTDEEVALLIPVLTLLSIAAGALSYWARCAGTETPLSLTAYETTDTRAHQRDTQSRWLPRLKVASACSSEWKLMYGDDCVRFCGQCSQNVYNLSHLTTEQAEQKIRGTEGSLRNRYYKRKDGTIIAKNCPARLRAIKQGLTNTRTHAVAAGLSLICFTGLLVPYRIISNEAETRAAVAMSKIAEPPALDPESSTQDIPFSEPGCHHSFPGVKEQIIRNRAILEVAPVCRGKAARDKIVVSIVISEEGEVVEAIAVNGHSQVKKLAEAAARRWMFQPVLIYDKPARVESTLTFEFAN